MPLFGRSRNSSRASSPVPPEAPSPPPPLVLPDVWKAETTVHYSVRAPWQWVLDRVKTERMTESLVADLPSQQVLMTPATPATRRRRTAAKIKGPANLNIEILNDNGEIELAVHGTSAALDGMEDKDELVRTIQRCRCENLNLSPPAVLISWDVSHDECLNVVGKELPCIPENKAEAKFAVLKEPMGSQGKGIYFVQGAEEIHKVIDDHRQRALNDADFLDNLIAAKGRIPSWVLQADVSPALLIKNRRKFHIRTYVAIIEKPNLPDAVQIYIFSRHEVRVAGVPVAENETSRDPISHITNGALSTSTERVLLSEVEELTRRGFPKKLEIFVAEIFGKHLLPDVTRRVTASARADEMNGMIRKFAVAGLDLMVTEDGRLYLLEVNSNPAAPPENTVKGTFVEHLEGFVRSLVDLVIGRPTPEFLSARDILIRERLLD